MPDSLTHEKPANIGLGGKPLKSVVSGRQAGATGAQEPECTRQYMMIPSTERARITAAQQQFSGFQAAWTGIALVVRTTLLC